VLYEMLTGEAPLGALSQQQMVTRKLTGAVPDVREARPDVPPALAAALRRIIEDAPLRRRLAATALEECRRTYSWEAVGRQIMQVYAGVHGRRPDTGFDPVLPRDPDCRFRAAPHLL
jgi:hypothetical protein